MPSPTQPVFAALFWLAVLILVAAEGALIVVALRLRRAEERPSWFRLPSRAWEATWTLLPLLLLLGLLLLSLPALRDR